ncbi:hypothetical protein HMSSN139_08870 [Paenibacillus sp. HMSSN-139]|nr:hypothetical protein HMSSN139_08870 [Paenibacillus sp. HMSSN-139]
MAGEIIRLGIIAVAVYGLEGGFGAGRHANGGVHVYGHVDRIGFAVSQADVAKPEIGRIPVVHPVADIEGASVLVAGNVLPVTWVRVAPPDWIALPTPVAKSS